MGGIPACATAAAGDGAVGNRGLAADTRLRNGQAEAPVPQSLVGEFDGVFFDDGIGEDVVGESLDILLRLVARDAVGDRDVEAFALTDIRDIAIAQTVQRGANRLALRIEYGGLEENEDSCFHQKHDYRTRERLLRAKAIASMAMPTVAEVTGSGVAVMLELLIWTMTS